MRQPKIKRCTSAKSERRKASNSKYNYLLTVPAAAHHHPRGRLDKIRPLILLVRR